MTTQIDRGNPLPPHGLPFLISSKVSFICIIPHITVFKTSRGTLVGTRNNSMGPPRRIDRTMSERSCHEARSCSLMIDDMFFPVITKKYLFKMTENKKSHPIRFERAHSEQAVIADACHGHTVQLSGGLSV